MSTLEARDLSCGYGRRRVFEALSLAASPGEVLVLLGPNGAGKTTLLRALARLLRPLHGSVLLYEKDIWTLRADEVSQRLAIMPQAEHRDWSLTVEDAVWFGRVPHRGWLLPYRPLDRQVVEQALATMSLCALRNRPITELSGGEWRRVIIARALAQEAKVLLLDEPTAGLDLRFQVEVLRLVRRLATEQQLVVVLTLHDLNQASFYGHRLALLSEHSLRALGSPQEVLTEELISQTFGVPVAVTRHPVYGTPLVAPLADLHEHDTCSGPQRVSSSS
jgi:iron complex transport system ATP-binding protein